MGTHSQRDDIREALTRKLLRRSGVTGRVTLPAVPDLLDEYLAMCEALFAAVGRPFSDDELAQVSSVLAGQLAIAFEASPRSSIVIDWEATVGGGVDYHVSAQWHTREAAYERWLDTRQPPLFGSEPDARVTALAGDGGEPSARPVLDVGGGTGRNALALARLGHPVDVVEATPAFAEAIRVEAAREGLAVRVFERDAFTTLDDLRRDYALMVLSEVASDFRGAGELRGMFEMAAACLAPGGTLVFNAFLTRDGYAPDAAARQLGQQCYASIFTRDEVDAAAAGLPLRPVSDESVYDYEQAHLPPEAWPPTGWYAGWTRGADVYDMPVDESPIEMRWLVYRRDPATPPGPA